jgi:hypothetical protein
MRIKFRINTNLYHEFYKNLVRKKLSDFLLEEERRESKKVKHDPAQQQEESMGTSACTISCPTSMSSINLPTARTNDEQ